MRQAILALAVALLAGAAFAAGRAGAPDEGLTRKVRALLGETKPVYPDPWRPRRTRPAKCLVIPGEKLTYAERLSAMALAGLVNRDGPRLFLRGHFSFNADADRFWLRRLAEHYGVQSAETTFDDALRRFRSSVRGCVVCDDKLAATQAVALTLAGPLRLLPTQPSLLPRLQKAGLPVVLDLRGVWREHVAAQAWALDALGDALSNKLVGFISFRTKALWGIADYLVMHGGFVGDLSSDLAKHPEEHAVRDRALRRLEPGSVVWGWVCHDSESQHVAHASLRGLRVLCSTNCPNLSFLSRIRPTLGRYRQKSPAPKPRPAEKKLYLTFVLSDGDSIPILLTRQWYRWDDPMRGKVPFGWEHQPLLADLAPVVFEYYYQTMTPNDRLIAGPSGAGYTHPEKLPDLGGFARETREYLRRADLHCIGVCAPWDEAAARAYAHGVPEAVGFFHGWGEAPARPLLMARGTPYLHYWLCPARPDAKKRETKDAAYFAREGAKLRRIVEREGLPCFVAAHLSCYWSTPSDVPKIIEAVGTDIPCELLLPDQFLLMMRQHLGDRILVRPPTSVLLMPGVDTGLALHLTSTRAQATSCTLRLLPPPGASVAAASQRVRIEPFGRAVATAVVRAAKPARGRRLTVELSYGAESERRRIPVRHVPPVDATQAGWLLHSLWEAEGLSHNAGAPASDADAHNGSAWRTVPGKHQAGTHIVWGPYEELPPGRYTAAFRVKVGQRTDAAVGRLDVFNHWLARQGKQGVRAVRLLRDTDFAAKRRYQDFSLDFERTATGKVEYRVHWTGRTPLSVDRIVVFRRR